MRKYLVSKVKCKVKKTNKKPNSSTNKQIGKKIDAIVHIGKIRKKNIITQLHTLYIAHQTVCLFENA